jgi:hypothetical protein
MSDKEGCMASYGFVIPIRPEMIERDREFAAELSGPRKAEFEESRARLGITREQVWLQETPQGPMVVVCLEADDIPGVFAGLATSQDPFDQWWRAQILEIHGLDLTQPLPGPPNDQIMDFRFG